jgi:hypothetical protein
MIMLSFAPRLADKIISNFAPTVTICIQSEKLSSDPSRSGFYITGVNTLPNTRHSPNTFYGESLDVLFGSIKSGNFEFIDSPQYGFGLDAFHALDSASLVFDIIRSPSSCITILMCPDSGVLRIKFDKQEQILHPPEDQPVERFIFYYPFQYNTPLTVKYLTFYSIFYLALFLVLFAILRFLVFSIYSRKFYHWVSSFLYCPIPGLVFLFISFFIVCIVQYKININSVNPTFLIFGDQMYYWKAFSLGYINEIWSLKHYAQVDTAHFRGYLYPAIMF